MKVIHFVAAIDRSLGGVSIYMQLLAKELGKIVDLHVVTHGSSNPVKIENATVHYIDSSLFANTHVISMKSSGFVDTSGPSTTTAKGPGSG